MAAYFALLVYVFVCIFASDESDDDSCLQSISSSCPPLSCRSTRSHISEESLQESEDAFASSDITLDQFIAINNDYLWQYHGFKGAFLMRWLTLKGCLRVIVKYDLVQNVSFDPLMRNIVQVITNQFRRRRQYERYCNQLTQLSELFEFADDIYCFVLQTEDAFFIRKLKSVLTIIEAQLRSVSIDSNVFNHRRMQIRDRMDEIYETMDLTKETNKELFCDICCHFVHCANMSMTMPALSAVQHQRMMEFVANHGRDRTCRTFLRVLKKTNRSFFPHPEILMIMKRLLDLPKESKFLSSTLLEWIELAVEQAKQNATRLIMR